MEFSLVFSKWNPNGWEWKKSPRNLISKLREKSLKPETTKIEYDHSGMPKYLTKTRHQNLFPSKKRTVRRLSLTGSFITTNQEFFKGKSDREANGVKSTLQTRIRDATLAGALGTYYPEEHYVD